MIYITGDTHGKLDFAKLTIFAKQHPELTKQDYLIICGDFGGVWNAKTLEEDLRPYQELPFTILFVDGNHENFDLLNSYPIEKWRGHGGPVHFIKPDIIHLMRGHMYDIEGKIFFTFGGATSVDKWWRKEGESWWSQEVPSDREFRDAIHLMKHDLPDVDYIVTHSCDEKALNYPPLNKRKTKKGVYPENTMLSAFENLIDYKHWYFGHYHMDADLTDKKTVLYQEIRQLV